MPPTTLSDLYVEELKDLYSAESQIIKALPKLVKAATDPRLKRAFEAHLGQTKTHVERLERIFEDLGKSPKGKKCHGMEGVLEEGASLIEERPEPSVLDAGLISAAQHVEHYEMAGYGSVRTWAQQLGHSDQADLLQATLDEERETDQQLTQLAEVWANSQAEVASEVSRTPTKNADVRAPRQSPPIAKSGARPRSDAR